ncbi:hypothetical protein EDC40_107274 [Aminobacter aminovorans]|uniref:Uncharacterized protein n=1 Tax=Aminobacter aminovorans TaxID=83263 RepID=A0A381IJZ9_AMIAI|nr:hypothetical protein [Aminobacter aminovorans]TCS25074.1 hypothetical protein EDC40_107274 [Aminobacter aminovorans]SUY28422.1 Uncharacterised protein [Aminobacter aminovorans]
MQDRERPIGLASAREGETSGANAGSFAPVSEEVFDAFMKTAGLNFEGDRRSRIHRDTRYIQMMRASIWEEQVADSSFEGSHE